MIKAQYIAGLFCCNFFSECYIVFCVNYPISSIKTNDYKYSDITGTVIGGAMKVHNTLGNGFQEVIYQRCLSIEMKKAGLGFERELERPIFYEREEVGVRRVDFLVEGKVLVELKAIKELEDVHLAQGLNYLEALGIEIGLLINFCDKRLKFKRLINTNKTTGYG